jgi:outer membrane protein OmpA-like peptidoglycan-associated protein
MRYVTPLVTNLAVLTTLCVVGCATTQPVPELDKARSEVAQVASDPMAREAAGVSLKKAQDSLAVAEQAEKEHKSPDVIRQDAYIASRQAQIAMEQLKEARARKEVEQGEADRNRVLLEARTRDANRALSDAERAKAEAQSQLAQATAARSDADAARGDADAARAETERLKQEMSDLQMKQTERGMVLTLGDVLFDTGRADLKPGATATMNRLSEFLHNHTGYKVLIEGHTDSVGTDEYNLGLSQRRADAVAGALAARGVESTRVHTRGLGKHYPVATNDTAAGRQQNRRVELVFSDDKGTFSPSAERTVL